MPSDCRELLVPNVSLNHPRRGAPCTLLTFLFLHPRSSLQQQPAVQGGPHFTEAYLHVPNDRIPPAAQVFKYVRMCVYIYTCWTSAQTQKPSECQQLRHYLYYANGWSVEAFSPLPVVASQWFLPTPDCCMQQCAAAAAAGKALWPLSPLMPWATRYTDLLWARQDKGSQCFQVTSTNTSHAAANELICGDGNLSETIPGKGRVAC